MVEVTRYNFDLTFPQFEKDLKNCSYVSLDCEFSYLPTTDFHNSLFDDGKQRYLKIKSHLQESIPLQVGLTIFTFVRDLRKYNASLYRFYVVQRPFGPIQKSMNFKTSNIQFLCNNKFDFNKCFYDGVSYLNNSEEILIRKLLTQENLIDIIDKALDYNDKETAAAHSSAIAAWLMKSSPGEIYEIPVHTNDISFRYFVHQEIRRRFVNTWTFNSEENTKITVKHISSEDRRICELNEGDPTNTENLIDSLLGFTKVFRLLAKYKKPLVGHNLLLDLLIMYHQFHEELPSSYTTFKNNIHQLFPQIFDTKLMAFEIQKSLNKVLINDTSLGKLYEFLQDKEGLIYNPLITFSSGIHDKDDIQRLHDAGWDSYFTGFCFIKLAYYLINAKNMDSTLRAITFKECLNSLTFLANCVSIARAKIPFVNLSGNDPATMRPPMLHVSWKNGKPIERKEIASLFCKYGLIHKKEYYNSLLLATPNYGCYKEILRDFKQHKDLSVERFSLLRHNRGIKLAFCLGIILPIGLTLWYGHSRWKK